MKPEAVMEMMLLLSRTSVLVQAFNAASAETPPVSGIASALEAIAAGLATLVQQLSTEVISTFQEPLLWLASVLGACVILASLAHLMRESDFDPRAICAWFARVVLCLMVFANTGTLFSLLEGVKNEIAGLTDPLVMGARKSFNDSYNEFIDKRFTTPSGASAQTEETVGALWDSSVPWYENVSRVFSPTSWSPPRLFALLTIGRALLSFSEIGVRVLWAFIRLALLLAAPFMIACGVDRGLAHRISYPYLWGLAVFYLVWPPIADVIATLAYSAGHMTAQIFLGATSAGGDIGEVGYAVCVMGLVLIISALVQLGSPYIAYRLSRGQVFEGVAGAAFGWVGAIAGTAIEYFGVRSAAEMEMLARTSEVEGAYQAANTTAESSRDASLIHARASATSAKEIARAAFIAQTQSNQAGLRLTLDTNRVVRDAQVALARNSTSLQIGEIETARAASLAEVSARLGRDIKELGIERDSANRQTVARTAAGVTSAGMQVLEDIGKILAAAAGGGAGAAGIAAGAEAGVAEGAVSSGGASGAGAFVSSPPVSSVSSVPTVGAGYGGGSTINSAPSLTPPGGSSPHALGEQPLGEVMEEGASGSGGGRERSLDQAASGGRSLITLGLGAFHIYNTGRVAGEHQENLTEYAGEMTRIADTRARELTELQKGALAAGVGIYEERNEGLNRAGTDAAGMRQSGINESTAIQQATAQAVYEMNVEAAETRYGGSLRAASIESAAGLRAAEMRSVGVVVREATADVDRKLEEAMQLRF